jgi:hypothetical protein
MQKQEARSEEERREGRGKKKNVSDWYFTFTRSKIFVVI